MTTMTRSLLAATLILSACPAEALAGGYCRLGWFRRPSRTTCLAALAHPFAPPAVVPSGPATPTVQAGDYAAALGLTTDALRLRRWTGASFAPVAEVTGLGLVLGDWYRLTATVTPGATAGQTAVRVEAAGVSDPAVAATLTATVNRYLPADGRFGVGTDQALARFSYFELTEV